MAMTRRLQIRIHGAVQGVGFRPFFYRLATEMGLRGWVSNSPSGVSAELEGDVGQLNALLLRLRKEKPPLSSISRIDCSWLDPVRYRDFAIRPSEAAGAPSTTILPDVATCADCLREIRDSGNRRYRYPFTNCTNCGPRLTIIEALPYDRAGTSMKGFLMCRRCRSEYDDPSDRRFHAEPNACPGCGPHLELWDAAGTVLSSCDEAMAGAAAAIRDGQIVAVKGLGGFHLIVDARNEAAVFRLRQRKQREAKPFALMFPSLQFVRDACLVSEREANVLVSPAAPIVLVRRRLDVAASITASVAPRNPCLGAMLPATPLHHILMGELGLPVVATSGNRSDEPICTDEREALVRLRGVADLFLVHDRPIVRHVDDSIVRVMRGIPTVLRASRGCAPVSVKLTGSVPPLLAVGAHLKSTIAITVGNQAFVSQHIGDLETAEAHRAFRRAIRDFESLYRTVPDRIACDLHPDFLSTKNAAEYGLPLAPVQHHHAHVASCMAEHGLEGPVLGVAWDGSGYGPDGTIWGGEFLVVDGAGFHRAASFRRFRLPGGEQATREPRRAALGLLFEFLGDGLFEEKNGPVLGAFTPAELRALRGMLVRGINSPFVSSVGRLFDALASLVGLRQIAGFEGQAAMELEFAADRERWPSAFPFRLSDEAVRTEPEHPAIIIDWEPMVRGIMNGMESGASPDAIAAGFHRTLVEIIVSVAKRVGQERVVLTGGCFQNQVLLDSAVDRLETEGFRPYWHRLVPPNDGGIALGQLWVVARSAQAGDRPPDLFSEVGRCTC
jgi:hydrogenase maturation protein HypF